MWIDSCLITQEQGAYFLRLDHNIISRERLVEVYDLTSVDTKTTCKMNNSFIMFDRFNMLSCQCYILEQFKPLMTDWLWEILRHKPAIQFMALKFHFCLHLAKSNTFSCQYKSMLVFFLRKCLLYYI